MSSFERLPMNSGEPGQSAGELDAMLRDFFRAEMPDPWPTLRLPASSSLASRRSGSVQFRSRSALAATVALLAAGSFFLARGLPTPSATSGATTWQAGDPQADRNVNERIIQDQKAKETPKDRMILEDRVILDEDGSAAIKATVPRPR